MGVLFFLIGLGPAQSVAGSPFAGSYDPTQDLLAVFGNKCQSVFGPSVKAALNQTGSLKAIVENLKNDNSCAGIAAALEAVGNLSNDALLASERARNTVRTLNEQSNELEVELLLEQSRSTPDPGMITALQSALYSKKIEVLLTRSTGSAVERDNRLETIKNFDNYARQLFIALGQNSECATRRPNLIGEIGAQLLAVSANLVSGLAGAILYTTGSVIDHFLAFLRNLSYSGELRALSQNQLQTAVHCAVESLATTICQARDMDLVTDHAVKDRITLAELPGQIESGLDVLIRDLPPFLVWAQRVDLGSPVVSRPQADERKTAVDLEAQVRKFKADTQARHAESVKKIARGGLSDLQVINELERLSQDQADIIQGYLISGYSSTGQPIKGPLAPLFNRDTSCGPIVFMWSKGTMRECTNRGSAETCLQCAQRITRATDPPHLEDDLATLAALNKEADAYVAVEVGPKRDNNPQLTLSYVDTVGTTGRTARQFLNSAKLYLDQVPTDSHDIPIQRNAAAARERIHQVLTVLSNTDVDPKESLRQVRDLIAPGGDAFFVATELREIIKQRLDQEASQGNVAPILKRILLLSNSDSLSTLVTGALSADAVKAQVRETKRIAEQNMRVLASVFEDTLSDALQQTQFSSDSVLTANEQEDQRALACVLRLLLPDSAIPDRAGLRNFCAHRTVYSAYSRVTNLTLSFDTLAEQPYAARVCALYDFHRESQLFELRH